ncbi:MAG TPA: ATP synthase subunit I [Acidobacteriota bacterium]|nr:ATP synthase subunit I [Acidobacteriota bacterium]
MNSKDKNFEEKILRRIPKEILVVSLILAIGTVFVFDLITAVLLFIGGAIAAISFIWLKKSITRLLSLGKKKAVKSAVLFYGLRLILIIAVIFIIILFFQNKVLAFAAGFSTIIVVFLIEGVIAVSKMMRWKN